MGTPSATAQHFSGSTTRQLLDHVEARLGAAGVDSVLTQAGETRTRAQLSVDSDWSDYAQFRALTQAAAAALGGPAELVDMYVTVPMVASARPAVVEMLQSVGGPDQLFATSRGRLAVSTIIALHPEQVKPGEWVITHRLDDGFDPYPELCAYLTAMCAMVPGIFGVSVTSLTEECCVLRGDDECTVRVTWESADDRATIAFLEAKLELAERSVRVFRETVADVVSDDDLETVLARIVDAAGKAIGARAFVLALEPLPWSTRRVYSRGMPDDQAEALAARLLDADADTVADRTVSVVHDVASTKRRYGHLAVVGLRTLGGLERSLVEPFARLAATALDSAVALEDSRRQAAASRALLQLSSVLSNITSTEEMAVNVARAVPEVIDCDVAAVVLVDGEVANVAGCHGLDPDTEALMRQAQVRASDLLLAGERYHTTPDKANEPLRSLMVRAGLTLALVTPVVVDNITAGALVVAVRSDAQRLDFTADLHARLDGLGGQVASALRNGRLLDQIRHQALHDPLTGLANRALVLDRAEHLLARARRGNSPVAALFVDLDGFKDVNDSLGHAVGDQLLRAVSARLEAVVRESDTVGRLGGDEFVVLAEGASLDAGAEVVAERLLDVLREPFRVVGSDHDLRVTASIGVAIGDRANAGELLRDADIALYQSKDQGKNCYTVFAPEMQLAVRARVQLESDLRNALPRDEYILAYQPIFDLANEMVTGAEALLRWQHPERGVVQPDLFIPLLEETGLICDVGTWVLNEACRQARDWHDAGFPIDISVNASTKQLENDDIVTHVADALALSGLPATSLIIEITETTIIRDAEATVPRLHALKNLGVRIAIDDFGTGYSSLAYLRQFPVDALKIDRSFISSIAESSEAGALIHTLVQLGKTLGLETLAEGIEDYEQFQHLQGERCDSGQGFLLARPLAPDDLMEFLIKQRTTVAAR